MAISTFGWILIGVAIWLVVATVVGVLIGRMLRQRDRQVPRDDSATPVCGIPAQGSGHDRSTLQRVVRCWQRPF